MYSMNAAAFCGLYVAKAGTQLFNKASKVVLVRDGDRTVLSMATDYEGDAKDFALVIPVPVVLEKKQINVGDPKVFDHIDAYTSPRLVEYHDPNPCQVQPYLLQTGPRNRGPTLAGGGAPQGLQPKDYKVTIEAEYEIGEYDVLILSAKESDGLSRWLVDNGYKIPAKAKPILKSYIKRDLKFFVAKVNLKKHEKAGTKFLKPLQIAYESKKFELPIRLGTVNAKESQDLFVFALTKTGRVESVNYRTAKIPSELEIPSYLKDEFEGFYKDMFSNEVKKNKMSAVFTEYAWDMSWCDPCAAEPLTDAELRSLGVWWAKPGTNVQNKDRFMPQGAQNVFVTRLHARYNAESFPNDLNLQVTNDRNNFQARYIMRHPYTGTAKCEEMKAYKESLNERFNLQAKNVAQYTGVDIAAVRRKMNLPAPSDKSESWIDGLWK